MTVIASGRGIIERHAALRRLLPILHFDQH